MISSLTFLKESRHGRTGVIPVVIGQGAKLHLDFMAKTPQNRISSGQAAVGKGIHTNELEECN